MAGTDVTVPAESGLTRLAGIARPFPRVAAVVMAAAPLLICTPNWAVAQNATVTITVDPMANRHPIDPNIYGVAHATTAQLNDLNTPLNRNGGNNTSRYNWQLNADNRGNDWYFESIADSSATAGERGDTFIANARAGERQGDADDPDDRLGREGRAEPQQARQLLDRQVRRRRPATTGSGSPTRATASAPNGQFVTGNDPNDANVPSNVALPAGLGAAPRQPLGHECRTAACATTSSTTSRASGTRPIATSIRPARRWTRSGTRWSTTRRRSRPSIRRRSSSGRRNGAGAATSTAATTSSTAASTAGASCPIATTTAAPTTCRGCSTSCDRAAQPTGQRLLDVFTVHYYPQGGEFSDDVSTAMQLRRNRSTRSLWDPELRRRDLDQRPRAAHSAAEELGEHVLPRHADRHHRVQLGRREPHQRRDDAGRHLRHLRPRGARHGRALDHARRRARRPTRR